MSSTELFYTYMTQGSRFTTPESKATECVHGTYFDEINDPLHTNPIKALGCNNIVIPLLTIPGGLPDLLGTEADLFVLDPPVENIKYIHFSGDSGTAGWISALDSNRNRIYKYPNFGVSANSSYTNLCCHAAVHDNYYGPLIVALCGYYSEVVDRDVICFQYLSPFDVSYSSKYSYPFCEPGPSNATSITPCLEAMT